MRTQKNNQKNNAEQLIIDCYNSLKGPPKDRIRQIKLNLEGQLKAMGDIRIDQDSSSSQTSDDPSDAATKIELSRLQKINKQYQHQVTTQKLKFQNALLLLENGVKTNKLLKIKPEKDAPCDTPVVTKLTRKRPATSSFRIMSILIIIVAATLALRKGIIGHLTSPLIENPPPTPPEPGNAYNLLLTKEYDKEKEPYILIAAAQEGMFELVEKLLEQRGYNASTVYPPTNQSALFGAAGKGNESVAKRLIKAGADINQATTDGLTPLSIAVTRNHTECVTLLLENNAIHSSVDELGNTPLSIAALHGFIPIVNALLEHGADINQKNPFSHTTALYYAATSGFHEVTKVLLAKGATIDHPDHEGSSPLFAAVNKNHTETAVNKNHTETARLLLEAGAAVDPRDKIGLTPLHIASYHGFEKMVRVLLESGADQDIRGPNNGTALEAAIHQGHASIIPLLAPKKTRDTGAKESDLRSFRI